MFNKFRGNSQFELYRWGFILIQFYRDTSFPKQCIIDTEDHITGECCLHEVTPWDEATLEQVVKSKNNWLCSP